MKQSGIFVFFVLFSSVLWAKAPAAKKLTFEIDLSTSTILLTTEKLGKKDSFDVTIASDPQMESVREHFVMQTESHVVKLERGVFYLRYIFISGKKEYPDSDRYVLHLEEATRPGVDPPPEALDLFQAKALVFLGTGMSSVDYQQQLPARAALTYGDFRFPSVATGARYFFNPKWTGALSLHMGEGGFDNPAVAVGRDAYFWSSLSAEALWSASSTLTSGTYPLHWGLKGGVVRHRLPFLHVNSLGGLNFKTNSIIAASLGAWLKWPVQRWSFETGLAYQHPVSVKAAGSDTLEMEAPMFIEISLGARFHFAERWEAGLFVFSQYQKFGFTYNDGTIRSQGDLTAMYSMVDARLGYFF